MKYLIVIQSNFGIKNATIFDTSKDAKEHLLDLEARFKYPTKLRWDDENGFTVTISDSNWVNIRLIRVERAEYRLVAHSYVEGDVERRFSSRNNAVAFVSQESEDVLISESDLGEWNNGDHETSFKLYVVILSPNKESRRVQKRFNAATSEKVLIDMVNNFAIDMNAKNSTKKEAPHSRQQSSEPKQQGKKKLWLIILVIIATILGIKAAITDWQLVSDEMKANSFSASSEVKAIADSLYFTRKGKAAFFASQPKLLGGTEFNKTCGRDGSDVFTSGCYYKDNDDNEHIEIYDVGSSIINENGLTYDFGLYRKSVVLHEALHAAWERLDDNKKSSVCSDLKTLSYQIDNLKSELSLYSSNKSCSELFARVGSEYMPLISPKSSVTSASAPITYSKLNMAGKDAASNLNRIYSTYYDVEKSTWVLKYWENENRLASFREKVENAQKSVDDWLIYTRSLINQYYSWPTWGRYNSANSAISTYNSMVTLMAPYISTYNKVYNKLDSERVIGSNDRLKI